MKIFGLFARAPIQSNPLLVLDTHTWYNNSMMFLFIRIRHSKYAWIVVFQTRWTSCIYIDVSPCVCVNVYAARLLGGSMLTREARSGGWWRNDKHTCCIRTHIHDGTRKHIAQTHKLYGNSACTSSHCHSSAIDLVRLSLKSLLLVRFNRFELAQLLYTRCSGGLFPTNIFSFIQR